MAVLMSAAAPIECDDPDNALRLLHLLTAASGTPRHFAAVQKSGRFRIEADIAGVYEYTA